MIDRMTVAFLTIILS